jgi:hypothetical protein
MFSIPSRLCIVHIKIKGVKCIVRIHASKIAFFFGPCKISNEETEHIGGGAD